MFQKKMVSEKELSHRGGLIINRKYVKR